MNEKIKELETQMADLRDEIHYAKLRAAAYENGKEMGTQIGAILTGLVDSGVDEDFAKRLVVEAIKAGVS